MAAAQRKDPCFTPEIFSTMPKHQGVVIDPKRIENVSLRLAYIEQWRAWCAGKLPHEIPSYINDLWLEENQIRRRYGESASGDWD